MKEQEGGFHIDVDLWYDTPKAFYPYTSFVQDRIFVIKDYVKSKEFIDLRHNLSTWFKNEGIKADLDNKIVFEVQKENGQSVFFGFYDLDFYVGLSVRSEHTPYVKGSYKRD